MQKKKYVSIFFVLLCVSYLFVCIPKNSVALAKKDYMAQQWRLTLDEQTKLSAEVKKIVDEAKKLKTDAEKAIFMHDYIIKNFETEKVDRNSYRKELADSSVFCVIVKKERSNYAFSKTLAFLYDQLGFENHVVVAETNSKTSTLHWFNKVKVDGEWYNMDPMIDSTGESDKQKRAIRYFYCLADDDTVGLRYTWDKTKYPASTSKNNWHKRFGNIANSQQELEEFVKKAAANKQKYVVVLIPKYAPPNYGVAFIGKITNVESFVAKTIGPLEELNKKTNSLPRPSHFCTEILVKFEYKK